MRDDKNPSQRARGGHKPTPKASTTRTGASSRLGAVVLYAVAAAGAAAAAAAAAYHWRTCADHHPHCYLWAQRGYCDKLPRFMRTECAASCGQCATNASDPCFRGPDAHAPGAIERTFRRASRMRQYKPRVLSSDPWIVVLDEFASVEECDALARAAAPQMGPSGSSCRNNLGLCTSSTGYCEGSCLAADAAAARLNARMLDVLQVPEDNCEPLGVFKYSDGQTFRLHHDQEKPTPRSLPGPRMYAMYVFLSDGVEGGETSFPALNLSIRPRRGRAFLWPHVRDDDLQTPDARTRHEGSVVRHGLKLGATLQAHLRDVRRPMRAGCELGEGVQHTGAYKAAQSPLFDTAGSRRDGDAATATRLLRAGASLDEANAMGLQPVHFAAMTGNADVLRVLLRGGGATRVEAPDRSAHRATPLQLASLYGWTSTVSLLLDEGARADATDAHGASALHHVGGHALVAELLLRSGADAARLAGDGRGAPLHAAAVVADAGASAAVAALLLQHGARADALDRHGATPLHAAAGSGSSATAALLAVAHPGGAAAAAAARDKYGTTPRDIAARMGHAEVLRVLDDASGTTTTR